ncbi:MAG: Hpt domain-containing protein [Pseudomonadota bacterium]
MAPAFNALLLSSVKSELDVSLAAVLREQEQFFSSGGKYALDTALTELHRLRSVLEMLNLHGLQAFCGEIETLLLELMRQPDGATVLHQDALRHALFGLTHYLDALENGAPNAALRLFPEYQELHQVRGVEMAFEVDLFFPELDVELPPELRNAPIQDQAAARIKQARMHFQQGLLKWLRQDDTLEALRAMSAALQVVLTCVPPAQRAFWWVAHGLLACVQLDGIPPELNAKKSFSRIDQRMRALLDGNAFDELEALSEMLYLIARSHTVNETVEHIKQVYDLDAYLPEAAPLPVGQTTAVLEQLRGRLNQANEAWEQCTLNDRAACQRFAELASQLYAQSEQLDRNTLQFLCKQIQTTAQHVEGPEHAPAIAMDMAMALLLLDGGIEHYQHLGSGFHEQVRLLTARLHEALTDRPEDQTKLAHLVALYCEMEQREVMAPLAKEMQDNLQHIEQTLNAFFGNAAKRNELLQVNRLLSQVQGGLHILTLDIAEQLLVTLRQIAERYHQGDSPTAAEMRAVATAISTLEEYVHGLTLGQKPDASSLESVLKDLLAANSGHAEGAAAVPEEEPAATVVAIRSGDEDAELLEVFLEEAQEVMETLRANLEIARLHMDSREPWITMRRGFHTLKGSGRMVGLTDLGEVAWAVERAMNKWIAANQPASSDLLELVGDAEVLFQHWVDMLRSGSTSAQIDTAHLLTLADCIEHDKPLPQPAVPTPSQVAPAVPEVPMQPPPEPAAAGPEEEGPVVIGEVSISPMLFNIASEEALEHARKLRACFEAMQDAAQPVVSYDFMRAAHTLAGVNRTMGFLPIAELAYTLEMWLEPRIDRSGVIGTPQLVLVDDVITRLNELCQGVRARQAPAPQEELIARLQADKLQAASEVPQEAPAGTAPVVDQAAPAEPELAASAPATPAAAIEIASVGLAPAAPPRGHPGTARTHRARRDRRAVAAHLPGRSA